MAIKSCILSAAFPPKSDDYDRIKISNKYEGLKITDVVDCQKYKTKSKKIKYSTYDIFTQEDLFNGLKDNKKLKANGYLELPGYKKCKVIKKFPLIDINKSNTKNELDNILSSDLFFRCVVINDST